MKGAPVLVCAEPALAFIRCPMPELLASAPTHPSESTEPVKRFFALSTLALAILAQGQDADKAPEFSFERALHTIYLDQHNPKFMGDGEMFCAPTSTAMEFSFLVQQGFGKLLPEDATKHEGYLDLIEQLGSADFMDTSGKSGTRTIGVVEGVRKYVESLGYSVKVVNYAGVNFGQLKDPCHVVSEMPDFDLLRQAVNHPHSIVLLNVGYYKLGAKREAYRRNNGHWVAVVGYGTDGNHPDPNVVLLHNPANKAPKIPRGATLAERLEPCVARISPLDAPAVVLGGRTVDGMMAIEGPALQNEGSREADCRGRHPEHQYRPR